MSKQARFVIFEVGYYRLERKAHQATLTKLADEIAEISATKKLTVERIQEGVSKMAGFCGDYGGLIHRLSPQPTLSGISFALGVPQEVDLATKVEQFRSLRDEVKGIEDTCPRNPGGSQIQQMNAAQTIGNHALPINNRHAAIMDCLREFGNYLAWRKDLIERGEDIEVGTPGGGTGGGNGDGDDPGLIEPDTPEYDALPDLQGGIIVNRRPDRPIFQEFPPKPLPGVEAPKEPEVKTPVDQYGVLVNLNNWRDRNSHVRGKK